MHIATLHELTSKRLAVIGFNASLQAAALSLSKPGIGLLVVCNTRGGMEGVLSKSDLIAHLSTPASPVPPASALMTTSIVSCSPEDDVHTVWQSMAKRNLQNIPIIDTVARPLGILDIRDAMKVLLEQEELHEQMLFNYVAGIGYQ